MEENKFWADVFYTGSLYFNLQYKMTSHYLIVLIDVQVKKYLTLYSKRQYYQVRTIGLIYLSMHTPLNSMSD